MPKFRIYGLISASIFIGEYEADTQEDAIKKSWNDPNANHSPALCHHCSSEIDIGDVYEYEADEVE